jgi:hypothetical protein
VALPDWDKAVQLSPEAEQPTIRMMRAGSFIAIGRVDAAITEAENVGKDADGEALYNAACVFALAAERSDETGSSVSKEECANRAVAHLRKAASKGFRDVDLLKNDDDLKAVRQRDDFKKLLADLEKKSP